MLLVMKIQSLSIVVPNKECANKCPFCVSRMVKSNVYPNKMDINDPHYDINVREYLKRLKYVANLGCNTVMLTGTSEPQQNKQFLATFSLLHQQLGSPFANIEMQTTGLFLNGNRDYLRFLRNFVGINTIALSVNALDDNKNNEILGHGLKDRNIILEDLCNLLKEYDFNIRLCLNLNDEYNWLETSIDELCNHNNYVENLFFHCKEHYHTDQITFRKLYTSNSNTPQGRWINDHKFSEGANAFLKATLETYPIIGSTQYGANIRDCEGISVIYDEDCMGKNPTTDVSKYLILRPNCKLYSSWDSEASLVC